MTAAIALGAADAPQPAEAGADGPCAGAFAASEGEDDASPEGDSKPEVTLVLSLHHNKSVFTKAEGAAGIKFAATIVIKGGAETGKAKLVLQTAGPHRQGPEIVKFLEVTKSKRTVVHNGKFENLPPGDFTLWATACFEGSCSSGEIKWTVEDK